MLNSFGFRYSGALALVIAAFCLTQIPTAFAANGSVVYAYDALGRVVTASYDTGVIVIYTYDANGNRLSQTINVNASVGNWGTMVWGAGLW